MDIFNLYKRAEYSLGFLNNCVDGRRECLPYFSVMFKPDPCELRHDWPDFGDLTARYIEAFAMAREMLKIGEPTETELALRKLLVSYFDEGDGLSYRPKPDKPYYSTIFRREYDAHVAEGFDQARVLWGLLAWYKDSGDESVKQRIVELVDGLDRILIKKDDYGYYDRASFEPGVEIDPNAEPMFGQFYFCGTQVHPLIAVYEELGIDKARELAERIANYIVSSNYFLEDGEWNCPGGSGFESAEMDGHTHSRFATIAGITVVGFVNKNQAMIERMKQCYDWFIDTYCSEAGWSPEFLGRSDVKDEGCETCTLMDQLNCCFAFTRAGYTGLFEQAERIVRNQLLENQMLDMSLVKNSVEKEDTELSCFHDGAVKIHGAFAGWAGPNDFVGDCEHHYCLMNCCGPAGMRAIYDAWSHIYTVEGDDIYVNIFMDRDGEELALKNHQPAEGLIEIDVKRDCTLHIAGRRFLTTEGVVFKLDGETVELAEKDGYRTIEGVKSGSKVDIEIPLVEVELAENVNGRDYTTTWIGDSVVDIEPKGRFMPMYRRREMP